MASAIAYAHTRALEDEAAFRRIDVALCRKIADMAAMAPRDPKPGHPLVHDQGAWLASLTEDKPDELQSLDEMRSADCGTSACLAGFTALTCAPEHTRWNRRTDSLILPDGTEQPIWLYAQEQLGLSNAQQDYVFQCLQNGEAIRLLRLIADKAEAVQMQR